MFKEYHQVGEADPMPDEPSAPTENPEPAGEPATEAEVSPEGIAARKRELDARYEALYKKHYEFVVVYLFRMGFLRDKARDLAQDTFVRVYQSMPNFRGITEAAERSFIKETALNVGLNEIRKQLALMRAALEVPISPEVENVLGDRSGSEEERLVEQETTTSQRRWLRGAIQVLPPVDEICLRLWLEGYSYDQIHSALHITEQAVRSRLRDIRRRLRKMLGEEPTGVNWP